MSVEPISDAIARCAICGEPMPAGEEMFKFHGYSGPCPKPPLPKPAPPEDPREARIRALETEIARKDAALRQAIDILQVQGFPLMADFCRAALTPDEARAAVEGRSYLAALDKETGR